MYVQNGGNRRIRAEVGGTALIFPGVEQLPGPPWLSQLAAMCGWVIRNSLRAQTGGKDSVIWTINLLKDLSEDPVWEHGHLKGSSLIQHIWVVHAWLGADGILSLVPQCNLTGVPRPDRLRKSQKLGCYLGAFPRLAHRVERL